jgi:hypothetical protein
VVLLQGPGLRVLGAVDNARLSLLPGSIPPGGGDDGGGEDQDDAGDGKDKPKKRGGRCEAVECACRPTWPVSKPRPSSKKAAAD